MAGPKRSKRKKKGAVDTPAMQANDILYATSMNISPDLVRSNKNEIDEAVKAIADRANASNTSTKNVKRDTSLVEDYVKFLTISNNLKDRKSYLETIDKDVPVQNTSGSYSVGNGDDGAAIADELAGKYKNHYSLMSEYNKICELIPELDKCVEMIVTDILNRDEISMEFLRNFYHDTDKDQQGIYTEALTSLYKEYKLDERIETYITAAEINGVKPISVFPRDDVIDMINRVIDERSKSGIHSTESLIPEDLLHTMSEENLLIPSPLESKYSVMKSIEDGTISTENNSEFGIIKTQLTNSLEEFCEGIVDTDLIDDWMGVSFENFDSHVVDLKMNNKSEYRVLKGIEDNIQSFKDSATNENISNSRISAASEISKFVMEIDRSIEMVDPRKSNLYQSSKNVKFETSTRKLKQKGTTNGYPNFFGNGPDDRDTVNTVTIGDVEFNINDDKVDIESYNKSNPGFRAIVTEHDPDKVFPVVINGIHDSYYIVEDISSNDQHSIIDNDRGSLADMVRRIGIGEDKALVGNTGNTLPSNSNSYSEGLFSAKSMLAHMGDMSGENGGKSKDVLNTIMIRTIAKRLGTPSLSNDGAFQSSILNMVKNTINLKNKVRFTYVPEPNMVYMSRKLNDKGLPLSVFDGTLFNCYMYLSSRMSSLMMKVNKAADMEVVEVNVGMAGDLNHTIQSIQKNLSTRNVSAKTLFGGTESILKNVSDAKRTIIPVFEGGERLYEVTNVERVNDVEIDDDFTKDVLKSAVMKIGATPTSLDLMSEDEYAVSQTQHRRDYKNLIVKRGVNYGRHVTKLLRAIAAYSDIESMVPNMEDDGTSSGKDNRNFTVEKINFTFTPPRNLMVTNFTEEIGEIKSLIDEIIDLFYGDEEPDNPEFRTKIIAVKKALLDKFATSIDVNSIIDIIKSAEMKSVEDYAKNEKDEIPVIDPNDNNADDDY